MAETDVATPPTETKNPGNIVSMGIPQKMDVNVPREVAPVEKEGAAAQQSNEAATTAAPNANETTTANETKLDTPIELTDEQLKAYFEKQGIAFDSMDKLKEKLNYTPPENVPTEEQKLKAATERENRMVAEHLSRKGTVEQFSTLKNIVASDKKALGMAKEVEDLVAEGFTPERAAELANERYFQLTDEQIEEIDDDESKKQATKQREVGLKKLEKKGAYLQTTAKSYLDTLAKDLEYRDAEKIKLEQHTSNVEDAIKKFQRKEQLLMGQIDGQDIAPIDFEFPEKALTSAKEILSDRAKFEQNLLTNDGSVNLDFILPHLIRSFAFTESAKIGLLTGQDRSVAKFKSTFSETKPTLGGPTKTNGTPGKITGFGEKQVFRPTVAK